MPAGEEGPARRVVLDAEAAIDAVQPLLSLGLPWGSSAVELLDDVVLDAAGQHQYRRYVELLRGATHREPRPSSMSVLRLQAARATQDPARSAARRRSKTSRLLRTLRGSCPAVFRPLPTPRDAQGWRRREGRRAAAAGCPAARKPITFVEDNAVPVGSSPSSSASSRRSSRATAPGPPTAHARRRPASADDRPARPRRSRAHGPHRSRSRRLARACGGIMSGEHGDRKVRGPLIGSFFGTELVAAFRARQEPRSIPWACSAPATSSGPTARPSRWRPACGSTPKRRDRRAITTVPHEHHHATPRRISVSRRSSTTTTTRASHAVETATRRRRLPQTPGGTMCPSYMARRTTPRDRGRGNALCTLAISGQTRLLGPGYAWISRSRHARDALAVPHPCKACKSRCPSNVDIRLKAEYTAQSKCPRRKACGG